MATPNFRLEPPPSFDFRKPDKWPRWFRRFDQFRVASGLAADSEEKQVSTLLYCLGEEAEEVLAVSDTKPKKTYKAVVDTFNSFFGVRRNIIYERARFNTRVQQEGESAEQYVIALHSLAENCEYGTLKKDLIRDRLVIGIRHEALSRRLQMDPELTLGKATRMVRQEEAVKEQQVALKQNKDGEGSVRAEIGRMKISKPKEPTSKQACWRCGNHHDYGKCTAYRATCYSCRKRGHFKSQCSSKRGTPDQDADEGEIEQVETAFLGGVGGRKGQWVTKMSLCGQLAQFKIDTGAEVTAISHKQYRKLKLNVTLTKPSKVLYGPANQSLPVLGEFVGTLAFRDKSCSQRIFVVTGLKNNLLGLPAIEALGLVVRIDTVSGDYKSKIVAKYQSLFQGLGTMGEPYKILLTPEAKPVSLFAPRRVPIPLREQVLKELNRMESLGIISKVDTLTPWCAGMVVVPKPNGTIRICVDLKPLNECVLREIYPLPKADDILAQLTGATVFSKLDANCGFWQIPLEPSSRLLTTFVSPFGRFCFNKLPFGISSAPELFQKRMNEILAGCTGTLCLIDDVLVFGATQEEHDLRLDGVLARIQAAGVTLNDEKCVFSTTTVKFLGHIVDKFGIRADPEKTMAINKMAQPTNVTELRRFMGMINQLGKFSPNLASITQPLRELMSSKSAWIWGPAQEQSFQASKDELSKPTVLALYNPESKTKLSADASSYGLGAVLLQEHDHEWKPVVYASRSLTETESRYAQIEKEALSITWGCEKFSDYILGKNILIETDHKPLVPLLSSKHLDSLPPRVLRFRLRLMRFSFSIIHVPGKFMYTSDALSRAPVETADKNSTALQDEVECHIASITSGFPATKHQLEIYRTAQARNPITETLIKYTKFGWPEKHKLPSTIKPYWSVRGQITLHNELLLFGNRIVVPKELQDDVLEKIHQGHQGILKCRLRAMSAVWWPGISKDVENLVKECHICASRVPPKKEPMIASDLPLYPWQKVGADLFELKGTKYLLVIDYFSRYVEIAKLTSTYSGVVIGHLKTIFPGLEFRNLWLVIMGRSSCLMR